MYVEKHPITPHCQFINTFPGGVREGRHKTETQEKMFQEMQVEDLSGAPTDIL